MALILKGGALFLHIPKTGGNWVTKVLMESGLIEGSLGPKHADITHLFSLTSGGMAGSAKFVYHRQDYLKYFLKKKTGLFGRNKPFMFCFVRNPIIWLESWFKYMSQPTQNWLSWGDERDINKWHPNSVLNGVGHADFNQYIRNVIKKRPGYVTEMYGWYTTPEIDYIGRQENLKEDLITILKSMELKFDESLVRNYPIVGGSREPGRPIVWDETLKEEVLRLEYAGLVRYGYLDGQLSN